MMNGALELTGASNEDCTLNSGTLGWAALCAPDSHGGNIYGSADVPGSQARSDGPIDVKAGKETVELPS